MGQDPDGRNPFGAIGRFLKRFFGGGGGGADPTVPSIGGGLIGVYAFKQPPQDQGGGGGAAFRETNFPKLDEDQVEDAQTGIDEAQRLYVIV